jgi:hypothetical protein
MMIGVCGIACEKCPRRVQGKCPHGPSACEPMENEFCGVATCAFRRGVRLCFECPDFPCKVTKSGPVSYGYGLYISGKD